jgi:hypothetical protein
MNAKDHVLGTAKRIVAEIVGDGRLAEEGARQTGGEIDPATVPLATRDPAPPQRMPSEGSSFQTSPPDEESRFAALLGHAALNVWPDLPRDAQECLFAAAVGDGTTANSLAIFLHDRHPKTAHPPKPARIARGFAMSRKPETPKMPASELHNDEAPDMRRSPVLPVGRIGDEGRDLVHGEGGTLGLGDAEDLNKDD